MKRNIPAKQLNFPISSSDRKRQRPLSPIDNGEHQQPVLPHPKIADSAVNAIPDLLVPSLSSPPIYSEMNHIYDDQSARTDHEGSASTSTAKLELADSPFSLSNSSSTTSLTSGLPHAAEYFQDIPVNPDRTSTGYSTLSSQTRTPSTSLPLDFDDDFPETHHAQKSLPPLESQHLQTIYKPVALRLDPVPSASVNGHLNPQSLERTTLGWRGSGGVFSFSSIDDAIDEIESEVPTTSSCERDRYTYCHKAFFAEDLTGLDNETDSDDDVHSLIL